MKLEIGSEFWSSPTTQIENGLFPDNTQWYLSGRSALQAIVKELHNCRTVALPAWCCDSMIMPFFTAGLEVAFYPVYIEDGHLIQDIRLDQDALFLMDYFGYSGSTIQTSDTDNYHGTIIRDVTHTLFSKSYTDADFYFGSLRKWCGISTGGFAWTKDKGLLPTGGDDDYGYTMLRRKAMEQKRQYIDGENQFHGHNKDNKFFLRVFSEAEECLEKVGIVSANLQDIRLAKTIDVTELKNKRRENASVLRSCLSHQLMFTEMQDDDCPLFVPIMIPEGKRDQLQKYLIAHDVFCPVHWPIGKHHQVDDKTKQIYENELSLVCDQRYSKEDMIRIVDTIRMFWKEN